MSVAVRELVSRQLFLEAWQRRLEKKEREVRAVPARTRLIDFCQYVKKDYVADPFHVQVAEVFEQFLQDVLAGKRPRVILSAPPQHGKTQLASRSFPPWAHGQHPKLRFICSSYGASWANQLSSDRLRIIASTEYQELFPDYKLLGKRSDYIENQQGGFMKPAGVDQGITGRSADIGIIDDPIKGYKEAVSETVKESIWGWYRQDFYSRLQQGAGVIVMMTRWSEDDLIGRLLDEAKNDGEQWQVFNFPAIAEVSRPLSLRMNGDTWCYDPREQGEPLAPGRFNLEALAAIKKVQGSYAWGALYQGSPSPAEGLMLKRDYWRYYKKGLLPEFELICVSVDASFKDAADSDHVAIHTWGFVGSRGYLIDRTCERMGYTGTKTEIKRMVLASHATVLLIEDKANGPAILEELRRSDLANAVSIIAIQPAGGKIARAWPFSADLEAGNAYLPENEPWGAEIVNYAAKFPTSPMDHDIDAMTQVFNWRRDNMHGLFEYLKNQHAMKASGQRSIAKVEIAEETPVCPNCGSPAVRVLNFETQEKRCNQCGLQFGALAGDEVDYLGNSRLFEK